MIVSISIFLFDELAPANQELRAITSGSLTVFSRINVGSFNGIDDIIRIGDWNNVTHDFYALQLDNGRARMVTTGAGLGNNNEVAQLHAAALSENTWCDRHV